MLFNKNNEGSEELQRITGTFWASNDWSGIQSEIDSAQKEVAGLIGSAVMTVAESIYENSETPTDENSKLLSAVQLVVAALAVQRFSSLHEVSHENNGRKVKVDENEKIPFEWMLDRDDRAMKERYYRGLSSLYSFLETVTDSTIKAAWEDSPLKLMRKDCIVVTLEEFERVYPIEGSWYMFYMILPLMIEMQRKIRKMIGETKWNAIHESSNATLLKMCQEYAVLGGMIKASNRWSLEVFPLSIARRFSPSYQGNRSSNEASREDIDWAVKKMQAQLKDLALNIQEEAVDTNPLTDYPLRPVNSKDNKYFTV